MPLLLLLVKATLILLAGLLLSVALQRAAAGARHLVWLVTLATLLLVPAVAVWSPLRVAMLPAIDVPAERFPVLASMTSAPLPAAGDAVAEPASSVSLPPAGVTTAAPARRSLLDTIANANPLTLVAVLWALVAAAIGGSLAWAGLTVRRIVRRGRPLVSRDWVTPLYEVSDRLGLDTVPRLLQSDDAKMPFACGLATPTIVLPADSEQWSLDRRRAVLLHELAHVRRHDLVGHTLARLVCAAWWFHPLVWTAARRLRSESERACDDLALASGARATDYAEHLLDIVTSVRRDNTPTVALAMARRKEFEGRMLAILDPEAPRSAPGRRQSLALIGSLALCGLVIGAAAPVARRAEASVAQSPVVPMRVPRVAPADSVRGADVMHVDTTEIRRTDTTRTWDVRRDVRIETASGDDADIAAHAESIGRSAAKLGLRASATALANASASTRVSDQLGTVIGAAVSTAIDGAARQASVSVRSLLHGGQAKSEDERVALLAKVLRTDSSANLRRVAAWGLNEHADERVAVEALANAVRRDPDASVREMAAWSLAESRSHDPVAGEALRAALRSDASTAVRATAAWSLGNLDDDGSVEALTAALGDADASVRQRAVWALGSIEPRHAPPALLAMLADGDRRTRMLAAWALYNIQDPASIPALDAALKRDSDRDLQVAYIRALASLGERSVDALKSLLESNDPKVKSVAVHALAGRDASGPWPWPWPQPRPFP